MWPKVKIFRLTKNRRADSDAKEFAKFIRNVGRGIPNTPEEPDGYCQLPREVCVKKPLSELVFKRPIRNGDQETINNSAILAPLNSKVDETNAEVLDMMPGEEHVFYSSDSTDPEHEGTIMPETLNSLNSSSLPHHETRLKVNAVVMLIRNLNVMMGLCNGTRLQLLGIGRHTLRAVILTGSHAGETVILPRITVTDNVNFPFAVHRHQFPIKLAFAMTINKAQGQTLTRLGIDLTTPVFDHGQLYTALSRAPSWNAIVVRLPDDAEDTVVRNVVFEEIIDAEEADTATEDEDENGARGAVSMDVDEEADEEEQYWNWAAQQYLQSLAVE
jgi:ATP-dependent DNA helicase PIF1